jgi:hypothetical protein
VLEGNDINISDIENRKIKPIWPDKTFKLSDYEKEEQ